MYSMVVGKRSPLDSYDDWSVGSLTQHLSDDEDDEGPNLAQNALHQQQVEQALRDQQRKQHILVLITAMFCAVSVIWILSQRTPHRYYRPPPPPLTGTAAVRPTQPPRSTLEQLASMLPADTQKQIMQTTDSPQGRAWQWITTSSSSSFGQVLPSPEQLLREPWRFSQLFALTTLFYALDGPYWPYNRAQHLLRHPNTTQAEWDAHQKPYCGVYCNDDDHFLNHTNVSLPTPGAWKYIQQMLRAASPYHGGRIRSLNLVGIDLSSTGSNNNNNNNKKLHIPPELSLLRFLQEISLGNHQGGFQHHSLQDILVPSITATRQLTSLVLLPNTCGQASTIPSQLGRLVQLQTLQLNGNRLVGTLPRELEQLAALRVLSLAQNNLRGTLHTEFGLLWPHLRVWNTSYNDFIGSLPAAYVGMPSLQSLDVSHNYLSGALPTDGGVLSYRKSTLRQLFLQHNNLTGRIPAVLLSNRLQVLDLSYNALAGSIPTQVGLLVAATQVNLSFNQLTGRIPSDIGRLAKTSRIRRRQHWRNDDEYDVGDGNDEYFDPYDDNGKEKTSTVVITNLVQLDISYNSLQGTIPLVELTQLIQGGLRLLNLTGNPGLTMSNDDDSMTLQLCGLNRPNCTFVVAPLQHRRQQCYFGMDCACGTAACWVEGRNDPMHNNDTSMARQPEGNDIFENLFQAP
ncbi:STYKc [Seminavis robusta]|uniref:STYKc n=1 Tax=Seminavis robusta TaxID=568900 RepID=A0A9N8DF71_9STRA|nr:STYKc [Seminavis robusta]|eukprot:Sro95_g049400.1 STYKc (682) ;mRNA; r:108790-110835